MEAKGALGAEVPAAVAVEVPAARAEWVGMEVPGVEVRVVRVTQVPCRPLQPSM